MVLILLVIVGNEIYKMEFVKLFLISIFMSFMVKKEMIIEISVIGIKWIEVFINRLWFILRMLLVIKVVI